MSSSEGKLPVPARWQPAVRAAMADTVQRDGLPPSAVTVTRVEPAPAGGLTVWLLAAGRSRRYHVDEVGVAQPVTARA
jgi:hypothetical protein